MIEFSATTYLWLKAWHLIALIAWMAGLFYLPRLFVYHSQVDIGSAQSELFKIMERRLYKAIMMPAMVGTLLFGLLLLLSSDFLTQGWMHAKLLLVAALLVFHFFCAKWKTDFARDANVKNQKFYRMANEVPTLLMIGIVILVIVRPF
ncbi:MAG: protoporphyrinogen oxidase HemJ [Rhodospirillales bacterium]